MRQDATGGCCGVCVCLAADLSLHPLGLASRGLLLEAVGVAEALDDLQRDLLLDQLVVVV